MMLLTARRGRLCPLLLFLVVLAVMVSTTVGVARGDTTTTLTPVLEAQTASFTVTASDLGDFAVTPPTIESPSAIVVNMSSGKVLYQRNAGVRRPMASTTKIMTALVVLENMQLTTPVLVSKKAAETVDRVSWLQEGDVLPVGQLLYGLLLQSSNSAAVALAEACSGSVEAFVAEMNAKAERFGLKDTHFVNANGLDKDGHYSTAADLAVLARYAMSNEVFSKIVKTKTYTIMLPGRAEATVLENTNELLTRDSWVTGVKTGQTPKAEQCLVASGTKNGVSVISVVLGQPDAEVCWSESEALMEYGFSQYSYVTLMDEGVVVAEATVPYQLDGWVQLVTKSAVAMELYKNDTVTTTVVVDRPLALPVAEGDSFGRVMLSVGDKMVGTVDLVAAQSFGEPTLGGKLAYYFGRLGRWLGEVI